MNLYIFLNRKYKKNISLPYQSINTILILYILLTANQLISVVFITFQNTFYLEIHQNNIFYF